MSTPENLQPALRQYRHNCGDDALLIGFDYAETINAFEELEHRRYGSHHKQRGANY